MTSSTRGGILFYTLFLNFGLVTLKLVIVQDRLLRRSYLGV